MVLFLCPTFPHVIVIFCIKLMQDFLLNYKYFNILGFSIHNSVTDILCTDCYILSLNTEWIHGLENYIDNSTAKALFN